MAVRSEPLGADLHNADQDLRKAFWPGRLSSVPAAMSGRLRGAARSLRPVTLWNYVQLLGGSIARLALSLLYFLALTRSLTIADFGFFSSAVAVGTILARLAAFGYGANLLQISATRRRTLGHYGGVYGLWLLASLPVCFAVAWAIFHVSFDGSGKLVPYLVVIAAEVVAWRMLDTISAVNSGLGRFGYAAAAYSIGTGGRALAALAFLPVACHDLDHWVWFYLAANFVSLGVVVVLFMPRVRLRYRRGTLLLRWRNALALGGSGLASSAQLEIDKVLVLTFGGAVTAGLYAICIRVIDLTALPTRAFNVLMIQRVLTNPRSMAARGNKALVEMAVAVASTATFAVLLLAVGMWPNMLGHDIARAAPLFGLLWAVPALRNLAEYQAELLYAHGRMVVTLWLSLLLTMAKTSAMALIFGFFGQKLQWVVPMNGVFLLSYAVSALITYKTLRTPKALALERR